MKLIIEDATPEFTEQLLALLADHAAHVEVNTDTTWTPERAERYWHSLPPRAQHILREAVIHEGFVQADFLRVDGKALRGHSGPLRLALERGVRKGWWPEGMEPPIQPQGPGFGKVAGYSISEHLIEVFEHVIIKTGQQRILTEAIAAQDGEWDAERAAAALKEAGRAIDAKRARELLRRIAATGLIAKIDDSRALYRRATDTTDQD